MLSSPLRDGSSRLRDWGLFLLVAALPAIAVGLLGLRALHNEEAALRRELRAQAEATALALEQRFAERIAELDGGMDPGSTPWAESVTVDAPEDEPSPGRESAASPAKGAKSSKACRELAGELRGASEASWRRTAETIARDCQDARTERGRSLWPLVALDPRLAVDGDRLARWLDDHEPRLDAVEREILRLEVRAASWLDDAAKATFEQRLSAVPAARGKAFLADHRYAMRLGHTPIRWNEPRSAGRLERQPDGRYTGFVVHAGSIVHAMDRGWPALPEGMQARLATGSSAPIFPVSHEARLLGDLRLVVGHPHPEQIARRSQFVLGGVAIGSGLLAIALAALLFSRMRRARQVSALRTDFVAAVSHELRTPIASVRMLAELLAEDRVEPEERQEVHEALAREAKRLGATVDRLLGFSRMEAGRARIDARPTDLRALVEESIATFEARFPDSGAVTRRLPEGELVAEVDPESLRMVLDNLLGNARKYAPEGAPYEVGLRRADGGIELSVVDHGPGIAKRHHRRIFRPFERADDRLSEATEGSGIGLSLVQHVARSHGGRAWVKSERGEGATFVVWLPDVDGRARKEQR